MEAISNRVVAERAWKRNYRLNRPKANLKVVWDYEAPLARQNLYRYHLEVSPRKDLNTRTKTIENAKRHDEEHWSNELLQRSIQQCWKIEKCQPVSIFKGW